MKNLHEYALGTVAAARLVGCAGISAQDKSTTVGAVGGAVLRAAARSEPLAVQPSAASSATKSAIDANPAARNKPDWLFRQSGYELKEWT